MPILHWCNGTKLISFQWNSVPAISGSFANYSFDVTTIVLISLINSFKNNFACNNGAGTENNDGVTSLLYGDSFAFLHFVHRYINTYILYYPACFFKFFHLKKINSIFILFFELSWVITWLKKVVIPSTIPGVRSFFRPSRKRSSEHHQLSTGSTTSSNVGFQVNRKTIQKIVKKRP